MATKKGSKPVPAALDAKVARKLLDMLSTDIAFRRLFKQDAQAALIKAGWKAPTGEAANLPLAGQCLQMAASDSIAPKKNIIRDRAKLEKTLTLPFQFTFACPQEFKN